MSVIRMALIGALLAATALPATDVGTAAVNQQDGAQTRPRLIVMFVVDQMSAIGLAGHGGTVVTWTDDLSASSVTSRAFSPTPIEAVRDFLHHAPYLADAKKTWLLSAPEDSYRYPGASAFARPPATQTSLFPHRFPAAAGRAPAFFPPWHRGRPRSVRSCSCDCALPLCHPGREFLVGCGIIPAALDRSARNSRITEWVLVRAFGR